MRIAIELRTFAVRWKHQGRSPAEPAVLVISFVSISWGVAEGSRWSPLGFTAVPVYQHLNRGHCPLPEELPVMDCLLSASHSSYCVCLPRLKAKCVRR